MYLTPVPYLQANLAPPHSLRRERRIDSKKKKKKANLAIRNFDIWKTMLYRSPTTDYFCRQLFRPRYSEKRAIVKVKCLVRFINLATRKKYLIYIRNMRQGVARYKSATTVD